MLCEKDTPLSCGYKSNYCGFIVPDMFIVGDGFDFDEVMREMPHVGCISKYGIEYYTHHKLFENELRVCWKQDMEGELAARCRSGGEGSPSPTRDSQKKALRYSSSLQCRR